MRLRLQRGIPSWRDSLALNPHLLAFGFAFTFFSCFGRTFFISLFGGEIRLALALSPGEFSYIYSSATLFGVVLMPWLGRLVDEMKLRTYATLLIFGLIGASAAMGFVTHAVTLFVVLFVFRLTGGSLMNHTAIVVVSRYFTGARATRNRFHLSRRTPGRGAASANGGRHHGNMGLADSLAQLRRLSRYCGIAATFLVVEERRQNTDIRT